jgi:hypothetical protein
MAALGHWQTYALQKAMSALPPKADMWQCTSPCQLRAKSGHSHRAQPRLLQSFSGETTTAGKMHQLAIKSIHERKLTITQSYRTFSYCIEHGLNICWRAGNDAKHVRSSRKLF